MEVEVWTSSYGGIRRAKKIWQGHLAHIPRQGEDICLNSDWCSETVKRVTIDLESNIATIQIETTDPNDAYKELE